MAANDPGFMIGTAPHASYALARTEIRAGESRVEEDNWVAAVEWADSLGADIINSSLGYFKFDDGFSYTYEDLDGMTAVTTIAANIASAKGIVVVNSAGNEGNAAWHYVTTPADGFEVIAVGAVDRSGIIATTSSRGPTADGRIKPEFVALGSNVLVIQPGSASSYQYQNGTSFASPAVAGAVALLLEVNPSWGPAEVREALMAHASRAGNPDTAGYAYGYGAIDALASSGIEVPEPPVAAFNAYNPYPQPVRFRSGADRIYFPVDVPEAGVVLTISIFSFGGDLVSRIEDTLPGSGELHDRGEAPSWDGTNFTGDDVAPGVYFYSIELAGYGAHQGKIAVIR
jgi:subtilisin family serine protease